MRRYDDTASSRVNHCSDSAESNRAFYKANLSLDVAALLLMVLYESEEVNVMNYRIRILKRNQTRETKRRLRMIEPTELVPNPEMVAHVKNCIDEFQAPRYAKTSSHAAAADTA